MGPPMLGPSQLGATDPSIAAPYSPMQTPVQHPPRWHTCRSQGAGLHISTHHDQGVVGPVQQHDLVSWRAIPTQLHTCRPNVSEAAGVQT